MSSGLGVGQEVTDGKGGVCQWVEGSGAASPEPHGHASPCPHVITHILALRLSEALRLAGCPGNLPRPQS